MIEKALNHLAKKLQGEEGEAKDKQRVIHDLAAVNGLEANPYVINERLKGMGKWLYVQTRRRGVSKV